MIDAQSTCTISVSLIDPSIGSTAALVVFDNAADGLQTLPLNIPISNGFPLSTGAVPLYFGAEDVGVTSASQFFRTFQGNLTLSGSIAGPNAADFSFVGPSSCIGAFGCSLELVFKPTAPGYRTATFSTTIGNVALTGVGNPGGAAAFLLSPPLASLNGYGGQITVSNVGGTVLNLSATVGGPDPGDFPLLPDSNTTCGATLASGEGCQLSVNFIQTVVGTRAAIFTVIDTASGLQHSVYLTANGAYPGPTVNDGTLSFFDNTQLGSQSAPSTVTANAPFGHALKIQLTSGADHFQIVSPTYCPGGTPCPITAVFSPTSTNPVSGTVLITDTTSGLTTTVLLQGVGGVPDLTFSSSTLTFAARAVGSTSTSLTVTLTNAGNAPASIQTTGITIAGANPGDFQETNTCIQADNFSGSPGQSCTISVTFTPTASGTRTAFVQIVSTAPSSPDIIQLTGTGN